jgi:hypothetical protein
METQRDFQWLRDWRKSVDSMRGYGARTAISIIVAGIIGAVWYAITHGGK